MKSIRVSLTVYFLVLLTLALGTASLLAYQTSYLTLQDKKAATEELIDKQYAARCKEEEDRLNRRLLDQAETLARLVEFRIELPMSHEERQATAFAWLLASLPGNAEAGYPGLFSEAYLYGGMSPQPPPVRREDRWRADPLAQLFRKSPKIKLNDDDQFAQLTRMSNQAAEYFQVDAFQSGSFQSEKLGLRLLPLDKENFKPNEVVAHDFDKLTLTPDNVPLRRVVLKLPTGMGGPPRQPRPAGPSPGGRDQPDKTFVLDFAHRPPIYIQCAAPTANLDRRLQELKDGRDQELAKVEAETADSRAALRNRLLGMSLLTFAVMTLGTWWLVRLGLLPLERLSVAVSKVSEKDFRLRFDEPRLPSELRPIHERLTGTLEQLKRAFAREKQATADISHELRTPLAALLTTMELALRKTRSAEEYREMFQDCLLSAQHMNQVVERLLALARLDAGVDHLRPKNVDVGQLAEQCAAMVRPLAEARGLNLTVNHRFAVEATIDPDKVREMMINLLHNAIQYNRPDGSVTLAVSRPNGHVEVAVSDTGIGIAADKQDQIFERFFRADPSRGTDGTHAGLGLAIVKGYVDLMGGTLDVESEVNRGSTFRIKLPVAS
jgi:signal transduction histidine kinase